MSEDQQQQQTKNLIDTMRTILLNQPHWTPYNQDGARSYSLSICLHGTMYVVSLAKNEAGCQMVSVWNPRNPAGRIRQYKGQAYYKDLIAIWIHARDCSDSINLRELQDICHQMQADVNKQEKSP